MALPSVAAAARFLAALALLAGCPSSQTTGGDAAPLHDAAGAVDASDGAWRHTITIDGFNDFTVAETFATTTAGYAAYVTWDDTALYVGYSGADIAVNADASETKWVLIYLDSDPADASGAAVGEQYNTQQPGFPTGFRADAYYRWKSNDTFEGLRTWNGSGWDDGVITANAMVSGEFVEVAIPWAAVGDPPVLGLVTLMLNELDQFEWSYAGLYSDNFSDGYYDAGTAPIPVSEWLTIDRSTAAPPTDPSRGPAS